MTVVLNVEVAMEQYEKRKKKYEGKQINNSSLPAGSSMHYYCRFCGAPTETLPESHICRSKTICDPCEILHAHGLI